MHMAVRRKRNTRGAVNFVNILISLRVWVRLIIPLAE